MTTEQPFRVSVIDPVEPAIQKTKDILFNPFDLGRWFVIGFCAWLANLGQGGFNFNGRLPFGKHQSGDELFARVHDFIMNNLPLVIIIGSIVVVIVIIVSIVLLWLNSRGKFMFLDCVAKNKAEVKNPWNRFSQQANSLFLFRLVVGFVGFIVFALIIGGIILLAFLCRRDWPHPNIGAIAGIIMLVLIMIPAAVAFAVFLKFTMDFVVPIMYLRRCSSVRGWEQFWQLLADNKGKFTLYILFQIVISMVIGTIVIAAMCLTCCMACCIMAIPYIGTVFILPLLVFQRAYSLMYLRQFGSVLDVFVPETTIIGELKNDEQL